MHYLIIWILCPRATNHAQCIEVDILIIYELLKSYHY